MTEVITSMKLPLVLLLLFLGVITVVQGYQNGVPHRSSRTACRRASVAGVSVSDDGFWAFLQTTSNSDRSSSSSSNNNSRGHCITDYWPLQVTADPQDATAATSPEALTLLQLLAGVDMAGAILPPDVLAKLVVLHAESHPEDPYSQEILNSVQGLPTGVTQYSETNDWQRAKVRLPQVTLDELTLADGEHAGTPRLLQLDVTVKGIGPLSFVPSSFMDQVCWTYDPKTSNTFVCLALALRYKAPIVLLEPEDDEHHHQQQQQLSFTTNMSRKQQQQQQQQQRQSLSERFPHYKSVFALHQTSDRVSRNIERGFEIHQLSGALRIARQRGDVKAEQLILNKLADLESMDDLPTQDESRYEEME